MLKATHDSKQGDYTFTLRRMKYAERREFISDQIANAESEKGEAVMHHMHDWVARFCDDVKGPELDAWPADQDERLDLLVCLGSNAVAAVYGDLQKYCAGMDKVTEGNSPEPPNPPTKEA